MLNNQSLQYVWFYPVLGPIHYSCAQFACLFTIDGIARFGGPLLMCTTGSCMHCCLGSMAMVESWFAACLVCDWRFAVMQARSTEFSHGPAIPATLGWWLKGRLIILLKMAAWIWLLNKSLIVCHYQASACNDNHTQHSEQISFSSKTWFVL